MKVLLTRSSEDCVTSAEKLVAAGLEPYILPLSETRLLQPEIADQDYQAIIFTSRNAIAALKTETIRQFNKVPIYGVGEKTAAAALKAGFKTVIAGDGDAEVLAQRILQDYSGKSVPILYASGTKVSFDMQEAFTGSGHSLVVAKLYEIVKSDPGKPAFSAALDCVTGGLQFHYSLESMRRFFELVQDHGCLGASKTMIAVCLSAKIGAAIPSEFVSSVVCARRPNERAMIDIAKTKLL